METPTNPTPTNPPLANDPAARTEMGEIIDRSTTPPANESAPESKPESSGAPESYTDFSVPEGHTLDAAAIESATPIFRELGLTQDQAQKLVSFYSEQIGKINAENEGYMEAMRTQWRMILRREPKWER